MARRLIEDEISRIFEEAANDQKKQDIEDGLTLSELQSIGAASGLDPAAIARAADKIKLVLRLDTRKQTFKSDIGVSGKAVLPGKITTSDWDELVSDIRHVMNTPGDLSSDDYNKEWKGGGLTVKIENGREEDRISLSARNAGRHILIRALSGVVGLAAMLSFVGAVEGSEAIAIGMFLLMASLLTYWINKRGLKKWADKTEAQMVTIVEKAGDLARNRIDQIPSSDIEEESAEEIMVRRVKEAQRQ